MFDCYKFDVLHHQQMEILMQNDGYLLPVNIII